jgi:hypothetical protein
MKKDMKLKHLIPVFLFAVLLSACGAKTSTNTSGSTTTGTKLLVNELAMAQRPFLLLVPHSTNRVFTFVAVNADKAKSATLDLEYTSGDLLKGARATLSSPIANPFVKAIILGSCSTGGKCSFDTDLKSGTMKLKLDLGDTKVSNVLKEDFTFVTGQNNLPDGKVTFVPSKATSKENLILLNSSGLPKTADKDILLYPVVITSSNGKNIVGTLTINQTGVTGAAIYDGTSYQTIKYTESNGVLTFALNNKPWSMSANITRDDQKGTSESLSLYILGPIILYK